MVANDDIICVFQDFKDNLEILLKNAESKNDQDLSKSFDRMYRLYIEKDRSFFHFSGKSDVLAFFTDAPEDLYRTEMLALLLYHDALLQIDIPTRKDLLEKSWLLYQYVCVTSNEVSLDRIQVIRDIENHWVE